MLHDFRIRKRLKGIFNKTSDQFKSHKEFNDYEEEVETLIQNLLRRQDLDQTNGKIEQYKKLNAAIINDRNKRKDEETKNIQTRISEEQESQNRNNIQYKVKITIVRSFVIYIF